MRRYLPFLIIVFVALVTGIAGAWLYHAKMRPNSSAATTGVGAVSKSDQGTESDSDHVRGSANAPATLEIYGDFQCPSCARTSAFVDDLQRDYGPRLRVIFREFPLAMHQHALAAAMAAEAAGLQGHFWEMHDMLYQYQEVWSKSSNPGRFFNVYAQSLGLDGDRFNADAKSDSTKGRIIAEGDAGLARGVRNTPTIFVNGNEVRGLFSRETLQAAIDAAIAGKKKS